MNDYVAITQSSLIENTKIGCDLYLKTALTEPSDIFYSAVAMNYLAENEKEN